MSQFFARIGEAVEVTSWEPRHVLAAGRDEVVATGAWSGVARPTGKSFTSDWGMVFGVRDLLQPSAANPNRRYSRP